MSWHAMQLASIFTSPKEKLADALPRMEKAALQLLLVVDEDKRLLGTVTDGDIRRALLRGYGLEITLDKIMCPKPRVLPVGTSLDVARKLMLENNIRHVPLVDNRGRVVDLLLWLDVFESRRTPRSEQVVIMAGGKGTRLDPFTKILPKPMIPLGDKPIVEVIMDKFYAQGFTSFILSLGYKAEIVRLYFSEENGRRYNVSFVQEDEPLGTAGSLGLLKGKISGTFIVSNCDVILEVDYNSLLNYHREKSYDFTVVGALKEFTIPYGVLRAEEGELKTIDEKPNFHFLVNTGVYVLEPSVLDLVTGEEFIHMTDLILLAREKGFKVGVYPHYGQWFDVGQWEEYRQTLRLLDSR